MLIRVIKTMVREELTKLLKIHMQVRMEVMLELVHKIMVAEKKLGVEVIDDFHKDHDELVQSIKRGANVHVKEWTEVDVYVGEALKDCKAVVIMPFADVYDDPHTDVKFSDDAEIVLSSC